MRLKFGQNKFFFEALINVECTNPQIPLHENNGKVDEFISVPRQDLQASLVAIEQNSLWVKKDMAQISGEDYDHSKIEGNPSREILCGLYGILHLGDCITRFGTENSEPQWYMCEKTGYSCG